jgi:membrane protease YdiL (CAAX protease family)
VVAFDLWVVGGYEARRFLLVLAVAVAFALLSRQPPSEWGLRLRPAPSLRWWGRATLIVAAGLAAFFVVAYFVMRAVVGEIRLPLLFHDRSAIPQWLLHACVLAPLVEEGIYRFALCTPLAPTLGRWPTILLSGLLFALLHHRYGVPGIDNQIAGFVLAWSYLRSGALWIPVLLHSLGNLSVVAAHLALLEGWIRIPGVVVT